jgi:H+/gluconate symporter-like permease
MMGGTLTAGILVGYVFVVPGLGTVAIAGLLDVPLGTMLIYGTVIGLPTAVLTTFIYGQILLITGIGGSLGAVIGETGLDKILGGFFSAEAGTPDLLTISLAWLIAAILHLAIGSISVAAITAAGILAPILTSIEVPTVVLGLAIGSGALFALQVNSNFFWMFETLLGLTTYSRNIQGANPRYCDGVSSLLDLDLGA